MMSEQATVELVVLTDKSKMEVSQVRAEVNRVGRYWQYVKTKVTTESRRTVSQIGAVVGLMATVVNIYSDTFGTVGAGLINMAASVIQSITAVQAGYAAGGPMMWPMIAMSVIALGIALNAQIRVIAGVDDMNKSLAESRALSQSMVVAMGAFL